MPFQTKTYPQFLSDILTSWAGLLTAILQTPISPNLPSGDPSLAYFESLVLCGLMFVQSQAQAVNLCTRAATSVGPDLDTWMADFSFYRKPAIFATGTVQFSLRTVNSSNIIIPLGSVVQTYNGAIQYQVIADSNKPAWNPSLNAYVITAGQLSANVTVQALVTGAAQNVQAAQLNTMASSVTGISFVTNVAPILNGADPELDQPLRDRFKLWVQSVNGKATPGGVYSAAINVPGVVAISELENQDINGLFQPGYGILVVDDGTGSPTASLVAAVQAAVEPIRGNFTQWLAVPSVVANLSILLNVHFLSSANAQAQSVGLLNVLNAVLDYVNSLEIGTPLRLENVSSVAKGADPNVDYVQAGSVRINGAAADYIATSQQVLRSNNILTTIGVA